MKKNYNIKQWLKAGISFLVLMLISINTAWADGSKDLYPSGAQGHRAHLMGYGYSAPEAIPFPNAGAHYVYARAGERITLASSAQNSGGSSRIEMWAPDGTRVVNNNTSDGQISNRAAELAGPRLFNNNSSGGYTPIYYQVPAGGDGIYRVQFRSRSTTGQGDAISANGNWTQGSTAAIIAWDISVINTANTGFVSGRVYATNLNFSTGGSYNSRYDTVKFNGKFYARTHDGYTYRITHKGTNGIVFAFFVNNNGFFEEVNGQLNLLYKSQNTQPGTAKDKLHNPNIKDTERHITHKMFYAIPDSDMPTEALASIGVADASSQEAPVHNTETWLFRSPVVPIISNVLVTGAEGSEGRLGYKGGKVKFDASIAGQYRIVLESNNPGFTPRVLTGTADQGANIISWDGRDGAGNLVLDGTLPFSTSVVLQGAEVHFPFFDVEYNMDGIVIELLDNNDPTKTPITDKVFWDDTDITKKSVGGFSFNGTETLPNDNHHLKIVNGDFNPGESSNTNGHIYARNSAGNGWATWGDEKSLDTWAFIQGEESTVEFEVDLIEVDLYTEVSYTIAGQPGTNPTKGYVGDEIIFTVEVGNGPGHNDLIADLANGVPGAPFAFHLPGGMEIDPADVTAVVTCANGTAEEVVPLTYHPDLSSFTAELSLPSGCYITYTFPGILAGGMKSQTAEATIMRIADVTDIDATNDDTVGLPPTNPHYECYNHDEGKLGSTSGSIGCNNIYEVFFMLLDECVDEFIYFENFGFTTHAVDSGRKSWEDEASISLDTDGSFLLDGNGAVQRNGRLGGATSTYLFAPGVNDSRYGPANATHSSTVSVARIKRGYYSVNPPGYVQMGIPTTDSWHNGVWDPNASSNDPDVANSNYDWTLAWDDPNAIRDMSGAVNGAAFLVRGAESASQSIKPFYEFDGGTIQNGSTYTLSLYSFVTYHDQEYMLMDVIDAQTGYIYATAPLVYPDYPNLPPEANATGVSFGWIPLKASVVFESANCDEAINGRPVKIAIRGSQNRSLETGKGFGHTLIDEISFTRRSNDATCAIPASEINCEIACFNDVQGEFYSWSESSSPNNSLEQTFTQPGTNGGFALDIYYLDNSFNMEINGTKLYDDELEFQSGVAGSPQNVRFKSDGAIWEDGTIPDIWTFYQNETIDINNKDSYSPVIRITIDRLGNAKLYGIRSEYGVLEELEAFDANGSRNLNNVHWVKDVSLPAANIIKVTQNVVGATAMTLYGYGQNIKDCEFCDVIKDAAFDDNNLDGYAQAGETITYTFDVKNAGDMAIHDLTIIDPLFGYNISLGFNPVTSTYEPLPSSVVQTPDYFDVTFTGDLNNNGVLDVNETWHFTVKHKVTDTDIYQNKGVHNRATVSGVGKVGDTDFVINEDSEPTDANKLILGRDENLPNHTYVPLSGNSVLITNPNIIQKTK